MLAKATKTVFVILSFIHLSACSTSQGLVNYSSIDPSIQINSGPVAGARVVGSVHGDGCGAVWTECTENATESARIMIANAKALGANAIGDIKWRASGNSTPSCKKGWGYVLVFPFLFTPLFMSAHVDAKAYILNAAPKKAGLYQIPADKAGEEALIRKIVAGN